MASALGGSVCTATLGQALHSAPITTSSCHAPTKFQGTTVTCQTLMYDQPTSITGCHDSASGLLTTCEWSCANPVDWNNATDGVPCCDIADDPTTGAAAMFDRCDCQYPAFSGDDNYCPLFPATLGLNFEACDVNDPLAVRAVFTCFKKAWERDNKVPCCLGQPGFTDTTACDPRWCPTDPNGDCWSAFLGPHGACTGPSACGRHKLLTEDADATGGVPCGTWYTHMQTRIREASLRGELGFDPATGQLKDNTHLGENINLMNAMGAIDAETARYCGAEGAVSGECACFNAYLNCGDASDANSAECVLALPVSGTTMRRLDAYCNTGANVTNPANAALGGGGGGSGSGSGSSAINMCNNDVAPHDRQVMNLPPGQPQSYDPSDLPSYGTLGGMPLHCWHPMCQTRPDLSFRPLVDSLRPCPSICYQYSSGANINIGQLSSNSSVVSMNNQSLMCAWTAGQSYGALDTPFAVADATGADLASLELLVPANAIVTFPLRIENLAQDTHSKFTSVAFALFSSLPFVSFAPATGSIPNGGFTTVTVTMATCTLAADSTLPGFIAIQDPSGANGQSYLPLALNIADTHVPSSEPGFTGPPPPDGYDAYARGLVAADDRRRDINVVHLHAAPARPVVVRRVPYAVPVAVHDLLDDDAAVDWGRARRAASATRASKARAARARATAEAARRAAESDADAAEEHAAKAKRARRSASAARTAAATAAVVASAKAKKARKRSKTPRGRKSKKTPLTKRRPKKSGKKA